MNNLLASIQAALDVAISGKVVDVTDVLASADALTEEEAALLQTSIANPKPLATHVSDMLIMLSNANALYQNRRLNSSN